jgi:hypothetical protein
MLPLSLPLLAAVRVFFRNPVEIAVEVLALRQQVAVLKRKRPLATGWPKWTAALAIMKPETVVGWQRAGFRLYWRWRSRPGGGRPKV